MPETFVPLISATAKPATSAFTSLNLKVMPAAAMKPAREAFQNISLPAAAPAHNPELCGKPVITLQRNGEIVSGIRIECGCGQVIELACVY